MRTNARGLALLAAFAGVTAGASLASAQGTQRAIDATRSSAQFAVSHIIVERVTGTIPIAGGTVVFGADPSIPQSVNATLDATKVKTDEPDRDRALVSSDFFDAQKFPVWTFASTKIVPKGAGAFEMDGTLTIHGVAQPERLSVTIGGDAAHPVYTATGQIDRHAFGMAITRLDPVIGGTVDVTLAIVLH